MAYTHWPQTENEPHPALSHHSVDPNHHNMSPLFTDPPSESLSHRAKVSSFILFATSGY